MEMECQYYVKNTPSALPSIVVWFGALKVMNVPTFPIAADPSRQISGEFAFAIGVFQIIRIQFAIFCHGQHDIASEGHVDDLIYLDYILILKACRESNYSHVGREQRKAHNR